MGTDNLFHKKRQRRERELRRIQEIRAVHDLVLIICEGSKTEPNYFKALRAYLHLNKEMIVIPDRLKGNDPLSLVKTAEAEFLKEQKKDPEKQGYDHVFVVFDKDSHASYNDALQKMTSMSKKTNGKFEAIISIPCFEVWLLLHFEEATRPYAASGNNSICDNVIHDLKRYIHDYEKGSRGVFEATYPTVDKAIAFAQSLEIRHKRDGTDNPLTKVHRLITYLQVIKERT
jgi:hypothetical protein